MDSLKQFIQSNPRPQELKRACAVQMSRRGYSYREIRDVLQMSLGFITQSNQRYEVNGIAGLKSNYWGTAGYLKAQQKQELVAGLGQKDCWTLAEVIEQVEDHYGVVYQSPQSYDALLGQAGLSWNKSDQTHPDKDEQQVEEKKRNSAAIGAVARGNCQWASAGDVSRRVSSGVGRHQWLWVESALFPVLT